MLLNSVLALIALAVAQKSTAKNFFPYPCTASKTSCYIGLLCIVGGGVCPEREATQGGRVSKRDRA